MHETGGFMWILSWNIQKINAEKAAGFSREIGDVVNGIVGNDPFVLLVLENKTSADGVMDSIGTGLAASQLIKKTIKTGGSNTLQENIIVIAGNGATFDEPSQFEGWHIDYESRCMKLHTHEFQAVQTDVQRLRDFRPTRSSTESARDRRENIASENTFRDADTLRNPISLTVRWGTKYAKVLVLHAPGPSDGQDHTETTAEIFAQAVFGAANQYDMVIGDFNLRTDSDISAGFIDQSMLLGATTKGSEEGRHMYSRLDRVYVRPGFPVASKLVSDSDDKQLTDHHCLAVHMDQREQRLISDYFQLKPSPFRRQEIGSFNRVQARTRRDPRSATLTYEKSLDRRRNERAEHQAKAREEMTRKNRM